MKKIIIVLVIVILFLGVRVFADYDSVSYRTLIVNDIRIYRFVDPDNGNVCYMTQPDTYKGSGIGCVK